MKRLFLVKTGERAIDIAEMMIGGFPAQFLSRESCAEVRPWLEIPLALSFLACDDIGAIWTPMPPRRRTAPGAGYSNGYLEIAEAVEHHWLRANKNLQSRLADVIASL